MPTKEIQVTVENQVLKLSNLDKLLFPYSGIIKAELIQYYQRIAPIMLPHIQNRPLTLIRFPDGIDKVKFYSKNKADWTPSWIASTKMPSAIGEIIKPEAEEIEYIMANNTPTLVWLANLAAIELHSMTLRATNFLPDQFIFDLDPPDGIDFEEIKKIAWDLKMFLEAKGYHPLLKTSGSKGLHIYVPILPKYTTDEVVENAKSLSKEFILTHPNTTLLISKERRVNKILIDINRNHRSQTCASAYSVRGKEGAPVSTPIRWEDFDDLKSSQQYNIRNIFDYLEKVGGDPWGQINGLQTPEGGIGTELIPKINIKPIENPPTEQIPPLGVGEPIPTKRAPLLSTAGAVLSKYSEKRDFEKTTEPVAQIVPNTSGILRYVIQKHDASNLHYDLRLESDGVLLSWAIPKAIPEKAGIKRMAIQTEPHPMKYLDFEGVIPKEEYGGGEMWVFDTGELTYIKKEDTKIRFSLSKGKITGEFYIYHTDGNKWLLERKEPGISVESISVQPMLAELAAKIPGNESYSYEIKWDGIRVIIRKDGDSIKIISRNGNDLTDKFPKIVKEMADFDATSALLDGEIVCLDPKGVPDFSKVISRMHLTGKEAIEKASIYNKATVYLFDMLYMDGLDVRQLPLEKRRKWLNISMKDTEYVRFSQAFPEGEALFEAIKLQQMEGIICKRKGSKYQSNARGSDWLKVKVKNTDDAIIIGYTRGKGDRALLFGSLILGQYENNLLIYKGKVGTGFDEAKLKEILAILATVPKSKKLIKEAIDEEAAAIWLEPKLWCEVQFASLTNNSTFREPVFVKIKEDVE
jgi:bifunctional non-homologous end joining protein LigD